MPRAWPERPAGSLAGLRTYQRTAALARAAGSLRATLTADDIAIERAAAAVIRLESMIDAMRRSGQLQQFNHVYKIRRAAATARGEGFMRYGVAITRLKAALIPMLQTGNAMRGVFEEVFR